MAPQMRGDPPIRSKDLLAIFLLGAVFRVALLLAFPEPYGEDGFGRIYFKDRIFLSHWLPLAQVIVHLAGRVSEGAFFIRLVFALLGALAACGFCLFLRRIVNREAALAGGVIFSLNPLAVTLSLMPYQDILFLGLYYAGLALLFGSREECVLRSWPGAVLYGLANLTRYEGWFALPALALWKWIREARPFTAARSVAAAARAAVFFGWAPAVWFLLSFWRWSGWNEFLFQTPDGRFYGWHPHLDLAWAAGYLLRWIYWIVRFASPPVFLLAVWGAWRLSRGKGPVQAGLKLLFFNGAAVTVFFFFIIGKQQETVFRFVTFPLSIVLAVAVVGLQDVLTRSGRLLDTVRGRRVRTAAWTIALAGLAVYSALPVAWITAEPRHRDPYRIAHFLEENLAAGERALVSADRSRDLQDDAPLLYQRIVAQARLEPGAVEAAGNLEPANRADLFDHCRQRDVRYLVVFDNFQPWRPADRLIRELADSAPPWLNMVLRAEQARVFRVREWPSP